MYIYLSHLWVSYIRKFFHAPEKKDGCREERPAVALLSASNIGNVFNI